MKKRSGFTLVELFVVLSVGSTLLALAIGLVHKSLTLSKAMQANSQRLHATNRFINQFRRDVHTNAFIVSTASDSLSIASDNNSKSRRKITYRTTQNKVLREESLGNGTVHREELILGERAFGSFQVDSEDQIAKLIIQNESGLKDVPPRLDRKVEAIIGRLRFEVSLKEPQP